ncbi:MFS transporter [Streptomyces sp. NPDC007818]|uniref:MFS transporter n=1 Tax=Streptomyces sp. NPDC007818 TaxID=3364780 RepID=UPI0036BAB5AB
MTSPPAATHPPPLTTPRPGAAVAVLCTGLGLIGLDTTVMNTALPSLQADLQPSLTEVHWIADAYTLALAAGVLAAGAWGDRHGRRRAFTTGLTICLAASLYGALADTPGHVIAARFLMGTGSALFMPSTLSLITAIHPTGPRRRRAVAAWACVAGIGGLTGPLAGGLLIEHYSWRAGFWMNLPVIVLALAGAKAWLPEHRHPHPTPRDPLALATAAAGLFLFVWAVIEAPTRGWTHPTTWTALAAATLLWTLARRRRGPAALHPQLLRDPASRAAALVLAAMFFALYGALYILTLYFQLVLGYSPARAGTALLPLVAAAAAGTALALPATARWGPRTVLITGTTLLALGFAALAQITLTSHATYLHAFALTAGTGTGLAAVPATEAIMNAVPIDEAGNAAAFNDLLREVAGAVGIAVLGAALTTALTALPQPTHTPAAAVTPMPAPAQKAFLEGLHTAAWTASTLLLLSITAAATHPREKRRSPTP